MKCAAYFICCIRTLFKTRLRGASNMGDYHHNQHGKFTVTTLTNPEYTPPDPTHPYGGHGTGPTLELDDDNNLVIGTLGQLKGAHIEGGDGYNIFQVNDTPGQVMGQVLDPEFSFTYYTINSAALLNAL